MMTNAWTLTRDERDFATLSLDVSGQAQNTLGRAVLSEFLSVLDELEKHPPKALFLRSGKSGGFMAGADIDEISHTKADDLRQLIRDGHSALDRLEALPSPTVAVIHGACLGGGLEIALACDHRIATEDASFGFPEVQLGLHPGLGGTYRFPRLIEPASALKLMLTGKTIDAKKAKRLGLVQDAVPKRHLEAAARSAASSKSDRSKTLFETLRDSVEKIGPVESYIAKKAREETTERYSKDQMPAPFAIIDLFEADEGSAHAYLEKEAASFVELQKTDTAKHLIGLFLKREELKREARSADHNIRHVHVIGAGTMGADIAAWVAMNGFVVTLEDVDSEAIARAIKRANEWMKGKKDRSDDIRSPQDRLIADPRGNGVRSADLIIEAGPEKADIKAKIYKGLEGRMKPDAILATNTSSIKLEDLVESVPHPDRFVGLHFFNPVTKMPLVEIVRGEQTSSDTLARCLSFVEAIDKLPLPVKSAPGFLVNRILTPYLLKAASLVDQGHKPEAVDAAAEAFGMAQGPIEVADTVGLDVCAEVGKVLAREFDHISEPPSSLTSKLNEERLGKKTGKGFYTWKDGDPEKDNVSLDEEECRKLQSALLDPLFDEVCRVLDEGIVQSADHLDLGAVFGAGFAPFRSDPKTYLDEKAPHRTEEHAGSVPPMIET